MNNVTHISIGLMALIIDSHSREAKLGALTNLARSLQYGFIGTADAALRRKERDAKFHSLANFDTTHDEFASAVSTAGLEDNGDITPEEKLRRLASAYWGVVNALHDIGLTQNERKYIPSFGEALRDYTGSNNELPADLLTQLKALEIEPGEFDLTREAAAAERQRALDERKPAIFETFRNAPRTPSEDFNEFPKLQQLKFGHAAWRGMYSARRRIVSRVMFTGKADDIGEAKIVLSEMDKVADWCHNFEQQYEALFELATEAGLSFQTTDEMIEATKAKTRARDKQRIASAA